MLRETVERDGYIYHNVDRTVTEPDGTVRPFNEVEDAVIPTWDEMILRAQKQEEAEARTALLNSCREQLVGARELLLQYGTPEGLSFPETYGPVQYAVLQYRDSDLNDPECEEHLQWITTRVGEITAYALFMAGVLE